MTTALALWFSVSLRMLLTPQWHEQTMDSGKIETSVHHEQHTGRNFGNSLSLRLDITNSVHGSEVALRAGLLQQ